MRFALHAGSLAFSFLAARGRVEDAREFGAQQRARLDERSHATEAPAVLLVHDGARPRPTRRTPRERHVSRREQDEVVEADAREAAHA
jgi:hypothetical protein